MCTFFFFYFFNSGWAVIHVFGKLLGKYSMDYSILWIQLDPNYCPNLNWFDWVITELFKVENSNFFLNFSYSQTTYKIFNFPHWPIPNYLMNSSVMWSEYPVWEDAQQRADNKFKIHQKKLLIQAIVEKSCVFRYNTLISMSSKIFVKIHAVLMNL